MRRRPVDDLLDGLDDGLEQSDAAPPMRIRTSETAPRTANLPALVEIEAGQRARRLPLVGGALTAGVGTATFSAAQAALSVGQPTVAAAIMAGGCLGSWAAIPAVRVWFRHSIPAAWRRDVTSGLVAAASWVDLATVMGPLTGALPVALLGGTAWATRRWNTANEVHLPGPAPERPAIEPPPAPVVAQIPMDDGSVIARNWNTRVAGLDEFGQQRPAGGQPPILKGALLTSREDLPNGIRWIVETPPGSTTFDEVFGRQGRIAHALQTDPDKVLIERVRGDSSRFQLVVVTDDPLERGLPYPGPEYHDGVVRIGGFGGGGDPVEAVVWQKGQGVRNGCAIGQMGSGKTALLELVMLGIKAPGCWRAWWGDGDPQGSSSDLAEDAADWFEHTPDGLLRQLDAFEAVLAARADLKNLLTEDPVTGLPVERTERSQKKIREFKPCPEYPGYIWFLPELGTLLTNEQLRKAEFGPRLRRVLRRARKFGLGVWADTQSGLQGDFDNDTVLRGFLTMVNAFCMRSTNKTEQYTMNGLQVSPGVLPDTGGWGFKAGGGRLAQFRTWWAPNLHDYLPGLPKCADDPDSADAIRPYLPSEADPEASLEESRARMAARRAAARAGKPFLDTDSEPAAAAAPAGPRTWLAGGVAMPNPADFLNVLAFPHRPAEPPDLGPVDADEVFPTEALAKLSAPYRAVLDVLAAIGPGRAVTNAEVKEKTGLRDDVVSKANRRLVELEMAHRDGHGAHRIAAGAVTTRSPAAGGGS